MGKSAVVPRIWSKFMATENETTVLGSFLGREMGPLLSGKSRLVKLKYYDLARFHEILIGCMTGF